MYLRSFIAALCIALLATAVPARCANHDALEIKPFDIPQDVNLPADFQDALSRNLVAELEKTGLFSQVFLAGEKPDGASDAPLRLTGQVLDFKKGNRAERYFVGFGAGKTSLKVHIQFIDAASGAVKFETDVDGKVIGFGLFGGDSKGATLGLAKEVARDAKKKL